LIPTVAWAVAVERACDVAVTVTLDGSPVAIVGAVYAPLLIVPHGFELALQETELLKLQFTAVLVVLVTVAVNVADWLGQPV
jgi:hypothetical protein